MINGVKSYEKTILTTFFADERPAVEKVDGKNLLRPPITKEEIIRVIITSKDRKAIGPDRIPVGLLKLLDDKSITVLQTIFK